MRLRRNVRVFRGQLDAMPFIGVLLLLVLFLLVNSSLVFIPGVPIRLPEARGWPGITNASVSVAVDRNGQLYFQNQVTDEAALRRLLSLRAARDGLPLTLVIVADRNVSNERIVALARLAQESGLQGAWLATRPPSAGGSGVGP